MKTTANTFLSGEVLYSAIFRPIRLVSRCGYHRLDIRLADGTEKTVMGLTKPDIYSTDGQPIDLKAELASGSQVTVQIGADGFMVALLIVRMTVQNPFAEVSATSIQAT